MTAFNASSCAPDTIVESACGPSATKRCSSRGDGLRSIDVSHLYVTEPLAPIGTTLETEDRTLLASFALDRGATSVYRDELAAEGELSLSQIDHHCCFSRCTPLVVGVPARVTAQIALPTPELCIPRPPAGTTLAAAGDRGCPAGVNVGCVIRGYVQTVDSPVLLRPAMRRRSHDRE